MAQSSIFTAGIAYMDEPTQPVVDVDVDVFEFEFVGADTIGFDDAREIMDRMAYDEWADAVDEYEPTQDDEAIAFTATQG